MPTAKSARGQIGKVAEKGFLGWRYQRLFADVCGRGTERFDFYRKWDPKSQERGQNDAKSNRNGAERVPKGTQVKPRGYQNGAKMEPSGRQGVPPRRFRETGREKNAPRPETARHMAPKLIHF